MNNQFSIGDILINKYNGEYYLVYRIEDDYTYVYVSLLSDSDNRNNLIEPYEHIDGYFQLVSKA
jgi:hypothetical protein